MGPQLVIADFVFRVNYSVLFLIASEIAVNELSVSLFCNSKHARVTG